MITSHTRFTNTCFTNWHNAVIPANQSINFVSKVPFIPLIVRCVVKRIGVGSPTLRRICYHDIDTSKHYVFITNSFYLSAKTIADIYKDRWQIELFFKSIKQNLKIHAFIENSSNSVMKQAWIAPYEYLLVCHLKFSGKLGWSIQRIMRLLEGNLFAKGNLLELLQGTPPPELKLSPKMRFVL